MYRRLLLAACGFVAALSVATVTHAASHPPIFAPPVPVDAYPNAGPVTIGDVDSDGNHDLVTLAGTSDGAIAVQLGNGDGTFQSKRRYLGGPGCVGIGKVTIADLTGDGTPDLAVACLFPNSVEVLPGPLPEPRLPDFPEDVPGTVLYATGDQPMALLVGHLDGPGDPDLVVANGEGTVSVLPADGNGGFQPKVDYPAGGGMPEPRARAGRRRRQRPSRRRRREPTGETPSRYCSAAATAPSSRRRASGIPSRRCSIRPPSRSATSTGTVTSISWSGNGVGSV